MENGICSLREIEKLCRNDIRYMYLLDGMKTPSFATFGNLIRNELTDSIEQIFEDINSYIFTKDHVDLQHTYIDGTKIEANANRYTWVWKKSCVKNRQKVFDKISLLIDAMNQEVLGYLGIKFEKREAYAVDYVSELLTMYKETTGLDETSFVSGRGCRKSCIGDDIMNCFLALIQLADISRNSIWLIIGNTLLLTASLVIKDNFQTWI